MGEIIRFKILCEFFLLKCCLLYGIYEIYNVVFLGFCVYIGEGGF